MSRKLKTAAFFGLGVLGTSAFMRILRLIREGCGDDTRSNVYVDFDGTIAVDRFPLFGEPLPEARECLTELIKDYQINIYSCRASPHWSEIFEDHDPESHARQIREYLDEHGIPYDRVLSEFKPPGYLICDKALQLRDLGGGRNNWREITNKLREAQTE